METTYLKDCWWVVVEGNGLKLFDAKGQSVPGEITLRVTDTAGDLPKAVVVCLINIAGSEAEMNKISNEESWRLT
jgi:hypothetical protein